MAKGNKLFNVLCNFFNASKRGQQTPLLAEDKDIGVLQSLFVMGSRVRAFFFKRKLLLELRA